MNLFFKRASFFLLILFFFKCSGPKDYILVIDTSKSMVIGDKVMDKLLSNMPSFLNDVKIGDTVTLLSFDSNVNKHGTLEIKSNEDRNKILSKIKKLKSIGAWTDMLEMLNKLSLESSKLHREGRKQLVVVMTDGLDDPSPLKKRNNIKLESLKNGRGKWNKPYVYYVSLGKLHDDKLLKNLENISPNVQKIEGREDSGLGKVGKDIFKREVYWILLEIIGVLLLIAALIKFINWFINREHPKGTLIFYNSDVGPSLKRDFILDNIPKNDFYMGRKRGANIKIREFENKDNLRFVAKTYKGVKCIKPMKKDLSKYKFINQRFKNYIAPGDKFEVGKHIFEFIQ